MSESEAGEKVEATDAAVASKSEAPADPVANDPKETMPKKDDVGGKTDSETPNAPAGEAKTAAVENDAVGSDPEAPVDPVGEAEESTPSADAAGSKNGAAAEGKSADDSATPEEKTGVI